MKLQTLFICMFGLILMNQIGCVKHQDIDITSRSTISGSVNGSAVEGKISATFNTGRGGSSTCDFSHLPVGFNPATFGTHT